MLISVDIREAWPIVWEGLQEVASLTDAEWIPEDIYDAVVAGKAFLFMDSSDKESFLVLSQYRHPYLNRDVLIVDVAYNKTGDAIARYQPEIEELAKASKSSYIEFSSPRAGFKRVAAKHGYETVCTIYRKTL